MVFSIPVHAMSERIQERVNATLDAYGPFAGLWLVERVMAVCEPDELDVALELLEGYCRVPLVQLMISPTSGAPC